MSKLRLFSIVVIILITLSCDNSKTPPPDLDVKTVSHLRFFHEIDQEAMAFDTLMFTNAFGNQYSIETLRYFISNVKLRKETGEWIPIDTVAYIDARYPDTAIKTYNSPIPNGTYTALQFTFGLDSAMNKTGKFKNFPEAAMEWPLAMGGGYHYMKLEGKYNDLESYNHFNFHTGPFQNNENYFDVNLPLNLDVKNQNVDLSLVMEIANWFQSPHLIDLTHVSAGIMGNQEMQEMIKANGHDVFYVK